MIELDHKMLFRCVVVWLFALAMLLGIPHASVQLQFAHGPLFHEHTTDTISLQPSPEHSINLLRPSSDTDELQPTQPSTLIAQFYVCECCGNSTLIESLGSLCRGMPIGQAPPSVY